MKPLFTRLSEEEKQALKPVVKKAVDRSGLIAKINEANIDYIDEGAFKAVYKVNTDVPILAVAASKEHGEEFPEEFRRLQSLHGEVPEYFPEPYAMVSLEDEQKNVLLMEYLDSLRVDKFKERNPGLDKDIADAIGYGAGFVYAKTGMFSKEPHDGNILLKLQEDGKVKADFVDVDHFGEGAEYELFDDYFLWRGWGRLECIENPSVFERGFDRGLIDGGYED